MRSPFVVGLASVIPGLGFVILNKFRWAVNAFFIVFGLFVIGLFVPSQFWGQLFIQFSFLAWIGQIYYAVQTLKLDIKRESGEVVAPNETLVAPAPTNLSRGEKLAYKSAELIRAQLKPGETLKDAVFAQTLPSMGQHMMWGTASMLSAKQCHIGLTNLGLVLLELDMLGRPVNVKRISKDSLVSVDYTRGTLTDKFNISLTSKEKIDLQVSYLLRKHTENMHQSIEL